MIGPYRRWVLPWENFTKTSIEILAEPPLKPELPNLYLHNKYNLQRSTSHTRTSTGVPIINQNRNNLIKVQGKSQNSKNGLNQIQTGIDLGNFKTSRYK